MGPFDCVVVGGGTAGCVVATRVSEDPDVHVLLIEAGPEDGTDAMKMPAKWLTLLDSDVDWGFRTQPQAGPDGAALAYPRGKVLGGSSGINAMTRSRADPSSYDSWAGDGAPPVGTVRIYYRTSGGQRTPRGHRLTGSWSRHAARRGCLGHALVAMRQLQRHGRGDRGKAADFIRIDRSSGSRSG
jgi:choline dehydrogenase-like flavoprotein